MRFRSMVGCAMLLAGAVAGFSADTNGSSSTITGVITDSICARAGSHQEAMRMNRDMGNTASECTIACVEHQGAKYVLYDSQNKKIYRLSNQALPRNFAGQAVKVTGTLKKNEIEVQSITAR